MTQPPRPDEPAQMTDRQRAEQLALSWLPGHPPGLIKQCADEIETFARETRAATLAQAIAKAKEPLLVFDGSPDLKLGVRLAGKLIVSAIENFLPPQPPAGQPKETTR
jgi:hypothetical protein